MTTIAIGGFQHETNTFAPSKADYAAFEQGGAWPPLTLGAAIVPRLTGANIPATGAFTALHAAGHGTAGLAWAAATPSGHVTEDAFERIVGELTRHLVAAGPVDGVYLDLHGAMVTEHLDDGEGEILARVRRAVGPHVPIVASLDLHANITRRMMEIADGMVAYRTYPHVDMAETGRRAAARGCAVPARAPLSRDRHLGRRRGAACQHAAGAGGAGAARPRPTRFARNPRRGSGGVKPPAPRRAGSEPA